jgi:hypothetical protein
LKLPFEKLGSTGAVIAAAACPVCFPKLALLGTLLGLGGLSAYESQLFIAAQALVVLAVAGHAVSFRRHRNRWILGAALVSAAAVFAGLYVLGTEALVYVGFAGLVGASAPELWARVRGRKRGSVITCPACGATKKERMPTDQCQIAYACSGCARVLRPKRGDCCVFCSYGSVKCPPMQLEGERHGAAS